MGAIKKLRDITENDVKEAWNALRERKPLIFQRPQTHQIDSPAAD